MEVSIITTCKGRLHHLKQTVPLMLQQKVLFDYTVIIVDYGDPDHCHQFDWGRSSVQTLQVLNDTHTFSPSRARNIGGRWATGEVLAFVDGDILLSPYWLEHVHLLIQDGFDLVTAPPGSHEIAGTCLVKRPVFELVRGYGEDLSDWGYQDHDFYNRVTAAGKKRATYSEDLLKALRNSPEERLGNYADQRRNYTGDRNKKIAQMRQEPANRLGYGKYKGRLWVNGKPHQELHFM